MKSLPRAGLPTHSSRLAELQGSPLSSLSTLQLSSSPHLLRKAGLGWMTSHPFPEILECYASHTVKMLESASAREGTCHQAWQPVFHPLNPHSGRMHRLSSDLYTPVRSHLKREGKKTRKAWRTWLLTCHRSCYEPSTMFRTGLWSTTCFTVDGHEPWPKPPNPVHVQ